MPGSRDRVSLTADDYPLGLVRGQIIEASKRGAVFVELHDDRRSLSVELPRTPALDEATRVVVVRLDSAARYGTTRVADTAALAAVARSDAGSESVALLRASDDITVTQVFAVADALRREGTAHIVLGLVGTSVGPPDDAWASCPFPSTADAQEIEGGFAQLEVEWDDEGRAGVVRVVSSSGHGFGGAAVLCALWQRSSSTQQCAGITQPCKQRVRVNFKRR